MSEKSYKIKNFTEFLEKTLKRNVLGYNLNPLTKPGDNYGAILQSVEVETACKNGEIEVNVYNNNLIFYWCHSI